MIRLGIITGLIRETRCLRLPPEEGGTLVRCAGPGPERAREAARELLDEGCGGLLSYGIAGGLNPDLGPGALIVADAVIMSNGASIPTDEAWRARLLTLIEHEAPLCMPLAGSDRVIMNPDAKRRLFETTAAAAVDMESHAVAEAALAAGVPFLVLRVISDSASGSIPRSAMKGVDEKGRDRPLAVMKALLTRPGDLFGLIKLGRDSADAMAVLRRVAAIAGPGFGLG